MDSVEALHVSLATESASASLAEGQRLSQRRSSNTGSPSEIDTELRGAGASPREKSSEKGFSEELAVAVALGVATSLADCVCVSDDVADPVRLALGV